MPTITKFDFQKLKGQTCNPIPKPGKKNVCPECEGKGYNWIHITGTRTDVQSWCNKCKGKGKLRKAPKKKTPLQKMVKKLDGMWSECVKLRDAGICQYKLNVPGIDPHHIFSRGNWSTRWLVENGVWLSKGAHHYDAHGAGREKFNKWIQNRLGETYPKLQQMQDIYFPHKIARLELVEMKLTPILERLRKGLK